MSAATEVPWVFEPADWETGICADLVIHPCAEDAQDAVVVDTSAREDRATRVVTITTTFQCPACKARTTATESQPSDAFAEPGREGW